MGESWPKISHDKAWIESEVIQTNGHGKCVTFWFHMYGEDIGELKVIMQVGQQSYSEVWSLSGDHGDGWIQGQAPMLSRGETFQVR